MMGKRTFHASVILIFFRVIHAFCEKYGLFPMRRFSMKNTFSLRGLFGMKKRDDFSPEPYAVPVTLAYSHIGGMAKTDSCSFSLHREGDKVFFDAQWYNYDTEREIRFDDREVPLENMERLTKLITQYELVSFIGKYKSPKPKYEVLDGDSEYLYIKMSDGSARGIASAGKARHDLYGFFTALAAETATPDDIQ